MSDGGVNKSIQQLVDDRGVKADRFIQKEGPAAVLDTAQQQANQFLTANNIPKAVMKKYEVGKYNVLNTRDVKPLNLTQLQQSDFSTNKIERQTQMSAGDWPSGMSFDVDKGGRIRYNANFAQQIVGKLGKKGTGIYDKNRQAGSVVSLKSLRKILKSMNSKFSPALFPILQVIAATNAYNQAVKNYNQFSNNAKDYQNKRNLNREVRMGTKNVTRVRGVIKKMGKSPGDQISVKNLQEYYAKGLVSASAAMEQNVGKKIKQWQASDDAFTTALAQGSNAPVANLSKMTEEKPQQSFQQQQQQQQKEPSFKTSTKIPIDKQFPFFKSRNDLNKVNKSLIIDDIKQALIDGFTKVDLYVLIDEALRAKKINQEQANFHTLVLDGIE